MFLSLLCILGLSLAKITIEVEPVRDRNDELCLRMFLEDFTTVVDIETDPYVEQQSLGVRITDAFGLFIEKMDVKDTPIRFVITPNRETTIDICLENVVNDASWSYQWKPREVSIQVYQVDDSPRNVEAKILSIHRQLRASLQTIKSTITQEMKSIQRDMSSLLRKETRSRDLNEDSLTTLNVSLVLFALVSFICQTMSFISLRYLAAQKSTILS